jgi:hypothetical protein
MGVDDRPSRPTPRPKVKVSPKRVKNKTIREAVYKKEKNARGGKDFTSTRGFKIKARKGDKVVTNKKGEKVVVRKSGNRVVTKKSGDVVRRKANKDRVISKKPGVKTPPTPPTGPYVSAPKKKYDPASTMATTNSKYTGGLSSGSDTRTGSENYAARRANNPALPKRSPRPRARGGKR